MTTLLPDLLGTAPADLIAADITRPRATEDEARARLVEIKRMAPTFVRALRKISDAYACRDWEALGYATWKQYRDAEFGELLDRTVTRERREAVAEMRATGMSVRDIAAVVRASVSTVHDDIARCSDPEHLAPARVTGSDGKNYASTRPTPPAAVVDGPAPAAPIGQDGQVWIAAARKGIPAHALKSKTSTRCDRSTRNGLTLPAGQARDQYAATWCRTCWPEGTPETTRSTADEPSEAHDPRASDTAGAEFRGSAPANHSDPLAGVGDDYEPDPARRIAAVAQVAPEYVRPVEPTKTATTGHPTSSPVVDGAGVDSVDGVAPAAADRAGESPVDHAAPAPAPPAASLAGGAGVTPAPRRLTLTQAGRVRAALAHLKTVGGTRVEERVYEVPYSSTSPNLSGSQPVTLASVQWWDDGEIHIRFLKGGGNYCQASTEFYASDVDQVLDVLCALRLLPAHLCTAYAAGVQAGLRGGDAIDGELIEEAHRA